MAELFATYTVGEIILFIIALCIAIKECVSFFDWAKDRLKKTFNKEIRQNKEKDNIKDKINKTISDVDQLFSNQEKMEKDLQDISDKINLLLKSDRDDIKSFITEKHHHFCYQKGWIDDYSLDCILKRFEHYQKEGGNSFIEEFVNELKELPKHPPNEKEE